MEAISVAVVNKSEKGMNTIYYFMNVIWTCLHNYYTSSGDISEDFIDRACVRMQLLMGDLDRRNKLAALDPGLKAILVTSITQYGNFFETFMKDVHEKAEKDKSKFSTFSDETNPWLDDPADFKRHMENLNTYSPKFAWVIGQIQKRMQEWNGGKFVIYDPFKTKGGIYLMSKILRKCGIENLKFTGDISSMGERSKILDNWNSINNNRGQICPVLLISGAGAVGINLCGAREMYIMGQDPNEYIMKQVEGRGIRYLSHHQLPPEERFVTVYRIFLDYDIPGDETTSTVRAQASAADLGEGASDFLTYKRAMTLFETTEKVTTYMKRCAFDCQSSGRQDCILPAVSKSVVSRFNDPTKRIVLSYKTAVDVSKEIDTLNIGDNTDVTDIEEEL